MHPALRITEIVQEIVRFLDGGDIKACCFVCWEWFHIAIDQLWERITSVRGLISILGPVCFDQDTWVRQNLLRVLLHRFPTLTNY